MHNLGLTQVSFFWQYCGDCQAFIRVGTRADGSHVRLDVGCMTFIPGEINSEDLHECPVGTPQTSRIYTPWRSPLRKASQEPRADD